MKKKTIVFTLAACFVLSISFVWAMWSPEDYTVRIQVVDEEESPIEGVEVRAGFTSVVSDNVKTQSIEGLTDKKGMTTLKGSSFLDVNLRASKKGWYDSTMELGRSALQSGETQVIHLRKIVNPIAMYAKYLSKIIPSLDNEFAFDLEIGDWVTPHGDGIKGSIHFEMSKKVVSDKDNQQTLNIVFPNDGDGFIKLGNKKSWEASQFKWDYTAPGHDKFIEESFSIKRVREPEKGTIGVETEYIYILRINTKLDEVRNVISCNYVILDKGLSMYGVLSDQPGFKFTYYLNPTPNDKNLEFDPDKNLFKDLDGAEKVSDP